MVKVLVIYYSKTGHTESMAEKIAEGAKSAHADVILKNVADVSVDELTNYDVIILGSPTYYGLLAAPVKQLLDESVKLHGDLEGKIGGAFASSANIAGGNETTVMSILTAWLIHGMIVKGDTKGSHYGPVAVGKPDERSEKESFAYGKKLAELANRIK